MNSDAHRKSHWKRTSTMAKSRDREATTPATPEATVAPTTFPCPDLTPINWTLPQPSFMNARTLISLAT